MHMKIVVEIFLIWTALDIVVGIPIWMFVKLRDRREASAVKPVNGTSSRSTNLPAGP
jgi:hypothetical protein